MGYNYYMRSLLFLFFTFSAFCLLAKGKDSTEIHRLIALENNLKETASGIITGETDSLRMKHAWTLFYGLEEALNSPLGMTWAFDTLRSRTVSIVEAPDKKFRLFTFNAILKNGDFKNFGYIVYKQKKKLVLLPLIDTLKKTAKDISEYQLEPDQWLGALYYSTLKFKRKGKPMYLLFGYDGATAHSNRKMLDVLFFDREGPHFGAEVFRESPADVSTEYRVIYEFHNDSRMVLRYEPKKKAIVLDKLEPAFPEATGDFRYYIPTGDYDYYTKTRKGLWTRGILRDFDLGQGEKPEVPIERPNPGTDPGNK